MKIFLLATTSSHSGIWN